MSLRLIFLSMLLLLSGVCGISYEVLYGRVLGNIIGDQLTVSASILMTFLLGIGLGTLYAHQLWRHLWKIEMGIGICGLFFALFTGEIESIIYRASAWYGRSLVIIVVVCFFILLIPAFFIGCSLPLFAGYLRAIKKDNVFPDAYALYNLGAALTVIAIEFILLRLIGLKNSLLFIATLNFLVALLLVFFFRNIKNELIFNQKKAVQFKLSTKVSLILASVASAIFQLLMLKIAECLIGPYRETFAIVLASILIGIAAGTFFSSHLKIRFSLLMLLNILGLLLFISSFEYITYLYAFLYDKMSISYPVLVLFKSGTIFLMMALPSFTFGATVPSLFISEQNVAKESGHLLFLSCMANVLGFMLMLFAMHRFLDYGWILFCIIALSICAYLVYSQFSRWSVVLSIFIAVITICILKIYWDENTLYIGYTNFHTIDDLIEAKEEIYASERFKGYQDVFAIIEREGTPYFFINGYVSIPLTNKSEKVVGAFSSLFSPDTINALVLGVGSGATANAVGQIFEHTDAVEINPVVIKNLFRMKEYNLDIEKNPQLTIYQDDAFHYAKIIDKQYALIINTVTTPLYFSSSKLYTHDFFQRIKQILKPSGVYVTWVDTRAGDHGVDIILQTISKNFAHCAIGAIRSSYYLLLCSDSPIRPLQISEVTSNEVLKKHFIKQHDFLIDYLPYGLLIDNAYALISDRNIPINTLDSPVLEFSMASLTKRGIGGFKKKIRSEMSLQKQQAMLSPYMDWSAMELIVHSEALAKKDSSISNRWKFLAQEKYPRTYDDLIVHERMRYFNKMIAHSKSANAYHFLGLSLAKQGQYEEAIVQYQQALKLNPMRNNTNYNIARCYERMNAHKNALYYFQQEKIVDPDDDDASNKIDEMKKLL